MARDEKPRWHPFLEAVEDPPLTWRLLEQYGREYGRVELVRLDGEPKYKATFRGELLGYGATLRTAIEKVHQAFISSHGHKGFAPNPWPSTQKTPPHPPEKGE